MLRARRVSDAARDLSAKLRGHAEAWRETDEALARLPECVARAWAVDKDVAETCDLMSQTEMLLLEAEIAVEVDELYRRDEETRVARRLAKSAHRGEVEKLEQFRRVMETEARDTQVTMKSAEEIALEEGLRRELRAIKKHARKQEKKVQARTGAAQSHFGADSDGGQAGSSRSFLPAPTKEDHYGLGVESDSGEDDVCTATRRARGEGGGRRRRVRCASAARDAGGGCRRRGRRHGGLARARRERAGRLPGGRRGRGRGRGEARDGCSKTILHGVRLAGSRLTTRAPPSPRAVKRRPTRAPPRGWARSPARAAEAIGLARKEALGLDDEDLIFVNLKPPPPSGGAGTTCWTSAIRGAASATSDGAARRRAGRARRARRADRAHTSTTRCLSPRRHLIRRGRQGGVREGGGDRGRGGGGGGGGGGDREREGGVRVRRVREFAGEFRGGRGATPRLRSKPRRARRRRAQPG